MPREPLFPPRDWARIEAVFDAVLDAGEASWSSTLDELCAEEPELRPLVAELVENVTDRGDILDRPFTDIAPDLLSELEDGLKPPGISPATPRRVGPYELSEMIGHGGMGVVYRAERADGQFEKQVAVKLMPQGIESPELQRRFFAERQILAQLEHPGIGRLLDGQVTGEGRPYLVMEYVEGRPVDVYCGEERLGLEDRLRLFLEVCDAVQYAHQNLVIHRDIKPTNILVTSEGQVKLLDFGIAKLIEPAEAAAPSTVFQPRTPQYASPEQLANHPASTTSDVYSLGVLLYLLLTGEPPYDLAGLSPRDAEEKVRFEDPGPPSVVATGNDASAEGPSSWRHLLRGDLDNIALKSLRKKPEERYATAEHLADDIRRYLRGVPVEARKGTWSYATMKFVRRHRLGVAAAALLVLSIGLGVAGVVWQGRRAEQEARRARRTAAVLSGLFAEADPFAEVGREMSVTELLGRSVERVREQLADDPAIRTELLDLLGRAYQGQGHSENAIAVHREALRDRRQAFGEGSVAAAHSMASLGDALRRTKGGRAEAEELYREALAIFRDELGVESKEAAKMLERLGASARERTDYPSAERHYREALRIARAVSIEPTSFIASTLGDLSSILDETGRREESIAMLRRALEMADETLGPGHPSTSSMRSNLAIRLYNQGDYEGAEELYRHVIAIKERALGADSPNLADTLTSLGRLLMDKGDFVAAEAPILRAVELQRANTHENDFNRIAAEVNFASLQAELGNHERAEPLYRASLEKLLDLFGDDNLGAARVRSHLAACLRRTGRLEEAEREAREALSVQRRRPARKGHVADTLMVLGGILTERGRPEQATPILRESLELVHERWPIWSWKRAAVALELGSALKAQGYGTEGDRLLREALPVLEAQLASADPRVVKARSLLASEPS